MSDRQAGKGRQDDRAPAPPRRPGDSVRVSSLLLLDITVGVVAFLLLRGFLLFVRVPVHPARFPQLAAALGLMTAGVMLMLLLALNASFFRVMTRRTAASLSLVAWVAAVSGVVLGVAMGGSTASKYAGYVVVGGLAFVFISTQDARLAKARARAAAARQGPSGGPEAPASGARPSGRAQRPPQQPRVRSRQRRGGRNR
ncbi:MAG TPA: hypothetical protein VK576_03540 [Thermoleophilia bacterium]|nr:hypothetical protein [Thermoleophilia bacterium]